MASLPIGDPVITAKKKNGKGKRAGKTSAGWTLRRVAAVKKLLQQFLKLKSKGKLKTNF